MAVATVADEKQIKERILVAAEKLFAKGGFDVSLKDITTLADANIAAVNYHFGSKSSLMESVFERLSRRVNAGRLKELEQIIDLASSENRLPGLASIIVAFIRPYFGAEEDGELLARLIVQHRVAPTALTGEIMKRHFDPMAKRFIDALALACSAAETSKFYRRYEFMVGAVVFTVADLSKGSRMKRLSSGKVDLRDAKTAMSELVAFLIGGMNAADLSASLTAIIMEKPMNGEASSKQVLNSLRPRR